MRKVFIVVSAISFMMVSCNVKDSKEYKEQQRKLDSLNIVNEANKNELAEMLDLIDNIESDFNQIRETEKIIAMESKGEGSFSNDKRVQIQNDMAMIREIIQKNKEEINKLNERLKSNNAEIVALKKTVDRLNQQLQERTETILKLQKDLENRDARINQLESSLAAATNQINQERQQSQEIIKQKDDLMNKVYYMFGTSKELKAEKIPIGGYTKKDMLTPSEIKKDRFIAIDKRTTFEIPVYAKKAKLVSEHPTGSFGFKRDVNGELVLDIKNPDVFWSITPYLIIEVK